MFSLVVNAEEADHSVCSLETTPGSHSLSSLSFVSSLYSFPSLNYDERLKTWSTWKKGEVN